MKKLLDLSALVGFYVVGIVLFLHEAWQVLWSPLVAEPIYRDAPALVPISVEMVQLWFVIGAVAGFYLYVTNQFGFWRRLQGRHG